MKKINVKEIIDSANAMSMEKGSLLYEVLKEEMTSEERVFLSFEGIRVIASPFFNASISYLFMSYDKDQIIKKFDMSDLPQYAREILNVSIHNALEQKNKSPK